VWLRRVVVVITLRICSRFALRDAIALARVCPPPSKAPNNDPQKANCTYHQQVRILKPLSRCLSGGLKSRCAAAVNSASFGYVSSARPLVCNPSNAVGEPRRAHLTAWYKYANSCLSKHYIYQWLLRTYVLARALAEVHDESLQRCKAFTMLLEYFSRITFMIRCRHAGLLPLIVTCSLHA